MVCPSSKQVGTTITLSASPTGGTAPYTYTFKKGSATIAGPSQNSSTSYTLNQSDIGNQTFSVVVTDSCPSGVKTETEQCTILVTSSGCQGPDCGYSITAA